MSACLSTYLHANSGHLKIKLFPKIQKNFREHWCEWTIVFMLYLIPLITHTSGEVH